MVYEGVLYTTEQITMMKDESFLTGNCKEPSVEVVLKDFSNVMDITSSSCDDIVSSVSELNKYEDGNSMSIDGELCRNEVNNTPECMEKAEGQTEMCNYPREKSELCVEGSLQDCTSLIGVNPCDGDHISNQINNEIKGNTVDKEVIACEVDNSDIIKRNDISISNNENGFSSNIHSIQDKSEIKEDESIEVKMSSDEVSCATDNGTINSPNYSFEDFILLANSTKSFTLKKFLTGCKWSPDGTCLMTNCADFTIRLFDLPGHLYNKQYWDKNETDVFELQPSLKVTEGGQIYDFDWYPLMSSWAPESCCFITTSSKAPVHLWDAYTGHIRASYRGYNKVDETENALSVKFSLNGEKIFCGYNNEIKIFDVAIPGRDYTNIDIKHMAGQSGIISCIAENPTVPNMFAAGSYKRTIGLYLESGDSICLLDGHKRGVTHIMWSSDGIYLLSGSRKDNEIICWDMRNPGDVVFTMERTVDTNQRIYFDLTPDGKYLISGNTTGKISGWHLNQYTETSGTCERVFEYQCHLDCANGISVHKQLPIIATTSGQHHYPDITSDDEDDANMFDFKKMLTRIENSVKLWWIGELH